MTYAPTALRFLQAYLAPRTGLSPTALGIVGDVNHAYGYHVGRDRIYSTTGQGGTDYSVRTARDMAGLSDAASALDIGAFARLRELSKWLVSEAQGAHAGTTDIREIIYSPDGVSVLRWDRERGYDSTPRWGEADSTHLWHTHISWYRDAETRDHGTSFRRFFDHVPTEPNTLIIGATLTFSGPTMVYARMTSTGYIGTRQLYGVSGLAIVVNELLVPRDPVKLTGGSFWRLTTGGAAGWLVSTSDKTITVTGGHL